jgi:hypothetical protein
MMYSDGTGGTRYDSRIIIPVWSPAEPGFPKIGYCRSRSRIKGEPQIKVKRRHHKRRNSVRPLCIMYYISVTFILGGPLNDEVPWEWN